MASKTQKELMQILQDEFYRNVHTLTLIHPTTKEFNEVFKKEMFMKNNKVGFQQVVYYLLSILDREKLKQKVPSWPPLDIRGENQFRNEVMKYINELNNIYVDANIPRIATSHLISPGGLKFVKFIFKLSQLVLREVIKNHPDIEHGILMPIQPSKKESVTAENIKKLQEYTNKINADTEKIKTDLDEQLNDAKLEAEEIISKQQETSEQIKELQQAFQILQEEQANDLSAYSKDEKRIKHKLQEEACALEDLKDNVDQYQLLMSALENDNAKLEYNRDLPVPSDVLHMIRSDEDGLEFVSLLEAYNLLCNQKQLEIKPLDESAVVTQTERFTTLNDQFSYLVDDMEKLHSDLMDFHGKLQNESEENATGINKKSFQPLKLGSCLETNSNVSNSGELAIPLPLSPSSTSKENILFDDCKTSSPF